MQWNLFLLILMGQCFFVMCQLYQYKFIHQLKNWTEARHHCKHQYTDLATVYDMTDMRDMRDKKRMQQHSGDDTWIGLNRRGNGTTWKWSDKSSSGFRPKNFSTESGNCVSTKSGNWSSAGCRVKKSFFCYKDKMKMIKKNRTWEEAVDHCREKHHDLVSITDQKQQELVQQRVKRSQKKGITEFIWLGLRYTCTLDIWFWVNGEVLNLDNWNSTPSTGCNFAAAMETKGHKWVEKPDDQKFYFICV